MADSVLSASAAYSMTARVSATAAREIGADAGDDVLDDRRVVSAVRRLRRHDPVAVEACLRKDLLGVGGIVQRDDLGVALAEIGEYLLRGGEKLSAFVARVVDRCERQG